MNNQEKGNTAPSPVAQPQTYEWPKPFSDDEIRAGLQSLIGSAVAQPQDEREAHRIAEELIAIYDSKKPAGGVHGQIVGMEPYIIKASGIALHVLLDAAEMLAARATPSQDAVDAVDTKRLELLAKSDWYVGPSGFYCDEGGGMNDYDDKNKGGIEALRNAIDAMQAQGAK